MISSYCLSPTRNGTAPRRCLHPDFPKFRSPCLLLPDEARSHGRRDAPLQLRNDSNRSLACSSASISSFAEPERESVLQEGLALRTRRHEGKEADPKEGSTGMSGVARAFNIPSQSASAISAFIAFAALSFPLIVGSPAGPALTARGLSYVALLLGFCMAWNIRGNIRASYMGSGALSLRQAVLMAAVLEFSGALLTGTQVTSTVQKGILITNAFKGKETVLFAGLLSSLAAAGTWLQVASYYGWPVSTTHCIVGSMVGFGLVYGGPGAVFWSSLVRVASSWFISPLIGALVSFLVYKCIRLFVYSDPNPGRAAAAAAPIAVFLCVTGISFMAFPLSKSLSLAAAQAMACGAAGAFLVNWTIRKQLGHLLREAADSSASEVSEPRETQPATSNKGTQLEVVYGVFGYMQVLSAGFMSFAHGGNDVSNAIGPLAAALSVLHCEAGEAEIMIPTDVLAWGGFGVVADTFSHVTSPAKGQFSGLMMWGYRVITTIGKRITDLTPTRGFAAEFAAASVVLFASKLGLPISATHTLVGAVMGVGFARGINSVSAVTVKQIVASWAVTIPVAAALAVLYTFLLTKLLSCIL